MSTWTQQYAAEDVPVSWSDPTDALTRGAPAAWIQALESGDIDVTLDGGNTDTLTFSAGETKSGPFVAVTDSEIDFVAGNGAVPVVPGGAVGATGATGPTGPTGPTGATGPAFTVATAKTTTYSAAIDEIVPLDPSGGVFTVTLPAISALNSGHRIRAKNVTTSTTAVTFVPTGSDTIDGLTSTTIAASRGAKEFVADFAATKWHVFTSS